VVCCNHRPHKFWEYSKTKGTGQAALRGRGTPDPQYCGPGGPKGPEGAVNAKIRQLVAEQSPSAAQNARRRAEGDVIAGSADLDGMKIQIHPNQKFSAKWRSDEVEIIFRFSAPNNAIPINTDGDRYLYFEEHAPSVGMLRDCV